MTATRATRRANAFHPRIFGAPIIAGLSVRADLTVMNSVWSDWLWPVSETPFFNPHAARGPTHRYWREAVLT